jgi:hypothetical protein
MFRCDCTMWCRVMSGGECRTYCEEHGEPVECTEPCARCEAPTCPQCPSDLYPADSGYDVGFATKCFPCAVGWH